MKTIKIIDLFYKTMTNEQVPKIIRYDKKIWKFDDIYKPNGYIDYICYDNGAMELFFPTYLFSDSNYEVAIIEEQKEDNFTGWKMYQDGKEVCSMDCSVEEDNKIEYVGKEYDLTTFYFAHKEAATMLKDMGNKMKELIDEVNKLKHDTK